MAKWNETKQKKIEEQREKTRTKLRTKTGLMHIEYLIIYTCVEQWSVIYSIVLYLLPLFSKSSIHATIAIDGLLYF